jgi:hypothetical protein
MGVQVHDHGGLLAGVRLHFQFSRHLYQKNSIVNQNQRGYDDRRKKDFILSRLRTCGNKINVSELIFQALSSLTSHKITQ